MYLPAPVSPVKTVRPPPKSNLREENNPKFWIDRWEIMA
jgi:hypothetical protein